MNATYLRRIEEAYQGEVYGEAMYLAIAAAMKDPACAYKWRVLAQIETETKSQLRSLVARYGGDTTEHSRSREKGIADAHEYVAMPWNQLMRRFSQELDADIAAYAKLKAECPSNDAGVLHRLVEHEILTKRFCDLELAGDDRNSIQCILDFCAAPPAP
jgi:hypothetical protein